MIETMTISIGIGLLLSVFMAEFFSLIAGGMVVPGYLAMIMSEPIRIVEIFAISILTWLIVTQIERVTVLFGRRRVTTTLLIGFILNISFKLWIHPMMDQFGFALSAFGYIIPGLISLWFDRQGIVQTLSIITINMVIIHLILLIFSHSTTWTWI